MFENFYGLNADPFRLSADHRFCFRHRSYARARASVEYALYRAEGFVMVTGAPGTGKTTLVKDLVHSLPGREVVIASLESTQLGPDDLLRMTAYAFGLDSDMPRKALLLQRLMEFLAQQHRQGLRSLLIIDEAQDLPRPALEELRLLTNLQRNDQPLLQIVLLGQEGLRKMMRSPNMEQLHQRLVAAWHLEPLSPEETLGYVRHRLQIAGWRGDPAFEPGVLPVVHHFSGGVPRRINLICTRLLLHGFVHEQHNLSAADAETVIEELRQEELTRPEQDPAQAPDSHDFGLLREREAFSSALRQTPSASDWARIDRGLYQPEALEQGKPAGRMRAAWEDPQLAPQPAEAEDERPGARDANHSDSAPRMRAIWEDAPPAPDETERTTTAAATATAGVASSAASTTEDPDPDREPNGKHPQPTRPDAWRDELREQTALSSDPSVHIVTDRDWEHGDPRGVTTPAAASKPRGRRVPILLWMMIGVLLVTLALSLLLLRPGLLESLLEGDWGAVTEIAQRQWPDATRVVPGAPVRDDIAPLEPTHAPNLDPAPAAEHHAEPAVEPWGEAHIGDPAEPPGSAGLVELDVSEIGVPPEPRPAPVQERDLDADRTDAPATTGAPLAERTPALDLETALATDTEAGTIRPEVPADLAAPEIVVSGSVFFEFDSVSVDPPFDELLDAVASALASEDEAFAEVFGYADRAGNPVYNRQLSQRRARAVASALVQRGIDPERLIVEGRGPRGGAEAAVSPRAGAEHRVVDITVRRPER